MLRPGARRKLIPAVIVVAIAALLAVPKVTGPVRWSDADSLYYQAQSLEVRGDGPVQARHIVMSGHPGQSVLATDRRMFPANARLLADPRWQRYSAPFYRRRWLVPSMTALVSPAFGERSLLLIAALGYVLAGLLLYMLLAARFAAWISVVVTLVILISPPVRDNLVVAGTDGWGLVMLLLALLIGVKALERGGAPLLAAWFAVLAVGSLTKEDGIVAVVAALWVAVRSRTVRAVTLAILGIVALAPADLLLGTSLQKSLAYTEAGFKPPPSTSWSYVLHHYGSALTNTLSNDLRYTITGGRSAPSVILRYALAIIVLAGIVLLVRRGGPDPYFRLLRGALLGGALFIAISINYTGLRLELVFVPALAVSLALLAAEVVDRRGRLVLAAGRVVPSRRTRPASPRSRESAM